jgi:rhodanese-related sulfurtransferase
MLGFFRNNSNATNVTIDEAHELLINNKDILILDVRTASEFRDGHIPNAINIPHSVLPARIHELKKYKDKMILVHCQSGGRSASAVNVLVQNGFTQVYHMNRGFGAWKYEVTV